MILQSSALKIEEPQLQIQAHLICYGNFVLIRELEGTEIKLFKERYICNGNFHERITSAALR